MSFSFINQMEENVRFNLCFPYHMHREKMLDPNIIQPALPESLHTHSFERLLNKAYREPFAFYLTEEDKKAYSAQELELISRVLTLEQQRINEGNTIIDLNLEPQTLDWLLKYKEKNNMTFEEAIIHILRKIVEAPSPVTTNN